jgi:cell division protein FtsB
MAARRNARRSRRRLLKRWLGIAVLAACALLYYQPLVAYLDKRGQVADRAAEVAALREERVLLERRLRDQTSEETVVREARKLAYVKPGEQLFIVKGIPEWRRARAAERAQATIGDDG